jgi:hypothetical protein
VSKPSPNNADPVHLAGPADGPHQPAEDPVEEAALVQMTLADRAGQRADAEGEQQAEHEDDRGMAEREEEPDRQRALAVGHQLARGVVDGADVVSVERVPGAERVSGQPDPRAERLRADAVAAGDHDREQRDPAEDVQADDRRCHPRGARPLPRRQRSPDAA